jgi:archaea-specific DNA-binding protein
MDYARPRERDTLVLSKPIRRSGKLNLVHSPKMGPITENIMSDMTDIASPADIEDGFEDGEEEPNMVRIGKKPIMNYVVACMTLLNTGVADVMVRGRGQSITKAVEVVEMLRRAFMKNIRIHSVDIGTEDVKREDGSTASLSMIEIIVGH